MFVLKHKLNSMKTLPLSLCPWLRPLESSFTWLQTNSRSDERLGVSLLTAAAEDAESEPETLFTSCANMRISLESELSFFLCELVL